MYFQLRKLILWPRGGTEPRVVDFTPGIVNVITGASKTGKSAVIPIVDYCLGSDTCAIPVGVIRENCSWFGIVVDTVEGQKLLARREPGDQQKTGDMVLIEGPTVQVPNEIREKNANVDAVKAVLNRLAGLSSLDFEPGSNDGFKSRPSFRDLMAFTFQPQNIVANPDVLFFKADTTEHREKLKTIFPYVLGAVTAAVLQARYELDRLNKLLRRKEGELREIFSASSAWRLEAQGWLRQAIELGLYPADQLISEDWTSIVDQLRTVTRSEAPEAHPSLAGIDVALARLQTLRGQESDIAAQLTDHRNRLNEMRRLLESSEAYGGAMRLQRDRLALAEWMRGVISAEDADGSDDPLVSVSDDGQDRLESLCSALVATEIQLRSHPSLSDTLEKEILRQRASTEVLLGRLNEIRGEISSLERESNSARDAVNRFDRTERFIGRLEQALKLYDRADPSSELREEIVMLRDQIEVLQAIVSDADIRRKLRNAISGIEAAASRNIPKLDSEWPDAPIRLITEELTIKVLRGNRDDYLWEIGSGANWLAYHVAIMLALQHFFLSEPHHPVPGLLVFDQPSQVYFPRRIAHAADDEPMELREQDIVAVRKVFSLLGEEVISANGRFQIIVLDHAGEDVWGELPGVQLAEEWRGHALVPTEWFQG